MHAKRCPCWKQKTFCIGDIVVLETDEDSLLPAEIQGVLKFEGLPGFVKGNKAFKIIEETEVRF